jgi:hypothetical protein
MPNGELAAEIDSLFNPEVDEDSSPREFPHTRLVTNHGFNFDFMEGFFDWEGSTSHPNTRICPSEEKGVGVLIKNSDVPLRLFEAALRVYGDRQRTQHGSQVLSSRDSDVLERVRSFRQTHLRNDAPHERRHTGRRVGLST